MFLRSIIIGALAAFAVNAVGAQAQSYTVQSIAGADLGKVSSAPSGQGDTVFTFTAAGGTVSKTGNGTRVGSATTRATVTIKCSNNNNCPLSVTITVTPGAAPAGKRLRALTSLTASSGTGLTVGTVTTQPSGAISFPVTGIVKNGTGTFFVGASLGVADNSSTGATGVQSSPFTVTTPAGSLGSSVSANVFRPLSVSHVLSLEFGRILRPRTGTSTVTLPVNSDTVSVTGSDGAALSGVTTRRGTFTVGGEGNQTFTISAAPFEMTGGGGSITVTPTTSAATGTIVGSAGSAGTSPTFSVGGSFAVSATTPAANYTGQYVVTVNYN